MKPYVNSYSPPELDYTFIPENYRNAKSDGYADITETGSVPGDAHDYTVELSNRILRNGTLLVKSNGTILTPIPHNYTIGPNEVGVCYDLPLLKFNAAREGESLEVTYTPMGSIVSASMFNEIQRAVVKVLAEMGAIDVGNLAKLNVTNTFSKPQVIEADGLSEGLEISAVEAPTIKFTDRAFASSGYAYYSGDLDCFVFDKAFSAPDFIGGGSNLYNIHANNITSGALPDARLSSNVPLKNATQTFSGANTFSSASNSFMGNGSALTSLNASQLTTGTLPDDRLSSNVARRDQANTFSALQTFNGGIVEKLTNISSNYSVLASDANIGVNLFGNFTATLPPLSSVPQGKRYRFFILNGHVSYNCTIKGSGSEIVISNAYANTYLFGGNGGKWLDIIASTSTEWVIMPGNQW